MGCIASIYSQAKATFKVNLVCTYLMLVKWLRDPLVFFSFFTHGVLDILRKI